MYSPGGPYIVVTPVVMSWAVAGQQVVFLHMYLQTRVTLRAFPVATPRGRSSKFPWRGSIVQSWNSRWCRQTGISVTDDIHSVKQLGRSWLVHVAYADNELATLHLNGWLAISETHWLAMCLCSLRLKNTSFSTYCTLLLLFYAPPFWNTSIFKKLTVLRSKACSDWPAIRGVVIGRILQACDGNVTPLAVLRCRVPARQDKNNKTHYKWGICCIQWGHNNWL